MCDGARWDAVVSVRWPAAQQASGCRTSGLAAGRRRHGPGHLMRLLTVLLCALTSGDDGPGLPWSALPPASAVPW